MRNLAVWLLCLVSSNVFADIIVTPPDLIAGSQYRLAFYTQGTRDARSSNIADYNTFVTQQANMNPLLTALGTTWKVIGQTLIVNARDNSNTNSTTSIGVPIYLLDGKLYANNNADLWDGQQYAVNIDQNGGLASYYSGPSCFTGIGAPLGPADDLAFVTTGKWHVPGYIPNNNWLYNGYDPARDPHNFYGISDVLTVAVPEPNSTALLILAGSILIFHERNRRWKTTTSKNLTTN